MRAHRKSLLCLVGAIMVGCVLVVFVPSSPAQQPYELAYCTYFGGNEWEEIREVFVLADGSVVFGGNTYSDNLPVTPGVVQETYAGEPAGSGYIWLVGGDCMVGHLSADGSQILAATYFGGSKQERAVYGMALDAQNNIIFGSSTRSSDITTTTGAYQETFGGGDGDAFVAKISLDMTQLLWSTYLGGSSPDGLRGGLGIDGQENVYLVGQTRSANFPTTPGAYQSPPINGVADDLVVKLNSTASDMTYGTLLGGGGEEDIMGMRVDGAGNAYLDGHTYSADYPVTTGAAQTTFGGLCDAFAVKLNADGTDLLYATYIGGSAAEWAEHRPLLLDDGSFIVTGVTLSTDFPTTPGAIQTTRKGPHDGFITKVSADGKQFVFSTYLGGSGGDNLLMPTIGPDGNLYVVGDSTSTDFPVTADALQATNGGGADGVLAVLSPDGQQILYATYLGGSGDDMIRSIAFGPDGAVYLVGKTASGDLPTTAGAAQTYHAGGGDGFIVKLTPIPEPATALLLALGCLALRRRKG